MPHTDNDPSIPLLTEKVQLSETVVRKMAGPLVDLPPNLPDFEQTLAQIDANQTIQLDKTVLNALESQIREQVLRNLIPRMETAIDRRLQNKLNELVNHVLIGLSTQIKEAIGETLHDAVTQSVADELLKAIVQYTSANQRNSPQNPAK